MKSLKVHITHQYYVLIFTVGHLKNILMEHDLNILMIFGVIKMYNFDPYNVLAIATNIPVLLMIGFVIQGHILF